MNLVNKLQGAADELLTNLGIKAEIKINEDSENDALIVDINADDATGLLIGKKGESLFSIQTALAMMLKNETGEWKRVVVNVGDYREKQEEYLKGIATHAADRAISTGEPQPLYNLTPSQRRIIHLCLSTYGGVKTESQGEGVERCLVVSKA